MATRIRQVICIGCGTTGLYFIESLHSRLQALGRTGAWRFLAVESTITAPPLNEAITYVPIGVDLGPLYARRHQLGLPEWALNVPQSEWIDGRQGYGKNLVAASLAAQLKAGEIDAAYDQARRALTSEDAARHRMDLLRAKGSSVDFSAESPICIIAGHAGGSTFGPTSLRLCDSALADGMPVLVLLAADYNRTHGNLADGVCCTIPNLMSLQMRAQRSNSLSGILASQESWTKTVDSIAATAAWLISTVSGDGALRRLRDGYGAARRKHGSRGWIAALSHAHVGVPAEAIRAEAVTDALAQLF